MRARVASRLARVLALGLAADDVGDGTLRDGFRIGGGGGGDAKRRVRLGDLRPSS